MVEAWRFDEVDSIRVCVLSARGLIAKGMTQSGSNCYVTTRLGLNRSMDRCVCVVYVCVCVWCMCVYAGAEPFHGQPYRAQQHGACVE